MNPRNGARDAPLVRCEEFLQMGPLERSCYRAMWRTASQMRRARTQAVGLQANANRNPSDIQIECEKGKSKLNSWSEWLTSAEIAARLMLARLIDSRPSLLKSIRDAAPVVVIDVTDHAWIDVVCDIWRHVLFADTQSVIDIARDTLRGQPHAVSLICRMTRTKDSAKYEHEVLRALSHTLPVIAISCSAKRILPNALMNAATDFLDFPALDVSTIARTIRILTGRKTVRDSDLQNVAELSPADLVVSIRLDRTPGQCVAELHRLLASKKAAPREIQDLELAQIFGLNAARAWADDALADIAAWRRGDIPWSQVASSVMITGPSGTGKTLFARAFAAELGGALVSGSYAKWQASGDGHLGDLLKAMAADFNAVRGDADADKYTPGILFIDEFDSFPNRAGVQHNYRDYTVQVVNALLEQLDGIDRLEGVIVIAATNDLARCDPALIRPGRFDRIVKVGRPDVTELEKMFRVRLGSDLQQENILHVAELAAGMTGADVEKAVNDAKRNARKASRHLTRRDLEDAIAPRPLTSPERLRRIAAHEAAHIITEVTHFGPDKLFATTASVHGASGAMVKWRGKGQAVTYTDHRKQLEVILAGRLGEELCLGATSHGAGGVTGCDLEIATNLAAAMVGSLGLVPATSLTYLGPIGAAHDFLKYEEIRRAVSRELAAATDSCRVLLQERRKALEAVAAVLFKVGRIEGFEVLSLMGTIDSKTASISGK